MARTDLTDESCLIDAGPWRLAFAWAGDRWRHEISVGGRALAVSEEWDVDRGDPARVVSPAYQQLGHRSHGPEEQALLVGQWGRHHFSAVFAVTESAGRVDLLVDVAVRTRAPLDAFAATYRVLLQSGDLVSAAPESTAWAVETPELAGTLGFQGVETPESITRLTLAEAGRLETSAQALATLTADASTHRLVYRWFWIASPKPSA